MGSIGIFILPASVILRCVLVASGAKWGHTSCFDARDGMNSAACLLKRRFLILAVFYGCWLRKWKGERVQANGRAWKPDITIVGAVIMFAIESETLGVDGLMRNNASVGGGTYVVNGAMHTRCKQPCVGKSLGNNDNNNNNNIQISLRSLLR